MILSSVEIKVEMEEKRREEGGIYTSHIRADGNNLLLFIVSINQSKGAAGDKRLILIPSHVVPCFLRA
jgi:hypothetical protein